MLKVAVTGNIGTGKTTVCKVFESLGISIYYADLEAKKLYGLPPVMDAVKGLFGDDVYTTEGKVDALRIADIVFKDAQKLDQLNALIHPMVLDDYLKWSAKHNNDVYTIYESALLFESGFFKHFDHSILVTAPVEMSMKRVLSRDGMSEADFRDRLARQMDEDKKSELADHIISNDEQSPLIPRIIDLHNIFLAG